MDGLPRVVRRRPAPALRNAPATLLFVTRARQEIVARCCARSRKFGVHPGMTLAEAKALCPGAKVRPFDAQASRAALLPLAAWCARFSPVVAVDPVPAGHPLDGTPDGLLMDVTGLAHLFGGEPLLVMDMARKLWNLGLTVRLAIAPTLGAAWALARFGGHPAATVDQAHLSAALCELPVAALRIPAAVSQALEEVNLHVIGHLLGLSRESLRVRFGEGLLLRLDQAWGRVPELLTPQRRIEPLSVARFFEGATTQLEAITQAVQELMAELAQRLAALESGVRGLRLEWKRSAAPPVTREFVLGRPSRDARHLWQLVRPKMESLHMGHGVEGVILTAHWIQTIAHAQTAAWGRGAGDASDAQYHAFLDTLVNRWGKPHVRAARPMASHVPELARQFTSASEPPAAAAEVPCLDRPSLLLEHPEPADGMALAPDHPPAWMRWRGREFVLSAGSGPERIVTPWWGGVRSNSRQSRTRDYFKVRTQEGSWLWVFRELESGCWFVHGLWA